MSRLDLNQQAYSYRKDASVPDFDDADLRAVMDAHCGLCSKGAQWIVRNDDQRRFKIIPLQSELGSALMHHYGLNPDDPSSWLFIENGKAYTSMDAVIRVGQYLGGFSSWLVILRIIPKPVQDVFYRFIARNRYRFFGKTDLCALPHEGVQERLLR